MLSSLRLRVAAVGPRPHAAALLPASATVGVLSKKQLTPCSASSAPESTADPVHVVAAEKISRLEGRAPAAVDLLLCWATLASRCIHGKGVGRPPGSLAGDGGCVVGTSGDGDGEMGPAALFAAGVVRGTRVRCPCSGCDRMLRPALPAEDRTPGTLGEQELHHSNDAATNPSKNTSMALRVLKVTCNCAIRPSEEFHGSFNGR